MTEFKKEWITSGVNHAAIDWAEELAEKKLKDVSTSQLRNFFDNLKKIQTETSSDSQDNEQVMLNKLALLRPKLAYAVGKYNSTQRRNGNEKNGFEHFYDSVRESLSYVTQKQHINHFVDLMEAILAFHKMHGKK